MGAPAEQDSPAPADAVAPGELIKLIAKLHWLGMHDEAEQLRMQLPEHLTCNGLMLGPADTD